MGAFEAGIFGEMERGGEAGEEGFGYGVGSGDEGRDKLFIGGEKCWDAGLCGESVVVGDLKTGV